MFITETYRLTTADADILAAPSRLNSLPRAGSIIVEATANQADGTNQWTLAVQLPDGEVPVDAQLVPASATSDGIDDRTRLLFRFDGLPQGGHLTLAAVESGTAVLWVRVTLVW